jgi:hypothetical protein
MWLSLPASIVALLATLTTAAPAVSETSLSSNVSSIAKRELGQTTIFPDWPSLMRDQRAQNAYGSQWNTAIAVKNSAGVPMHLWVQRRDQTVGEYFTRLQPGHWLLLSNLERDVLNYNGAIRGYIGCGDGGWGCEDILGSVSKFEWTTGANNHLEDWNLNLSFGTFCFSILFSKVFTTNLNLVDGYNIGMEFFPGGTCTQYSKQHCHISHDDVVRECPDNKLRHKEVNGRTYSTCQSDCRAWDINCGDEVANRELAHHCTDVYWDNTNGHNETCRPEGIIQLILKA